MDPLVNAIELESALCAMKVCICTKREREKALHFTVEYFIVVYLASVTNPSGTREGIGLTVTSLFLRWEGDSQQPTSVDLGAYGVTYDVIDCFSFSFFFFARCKIQFALASSLAKNTSV